MSVRFANPYRAHFENVCRTVTDELKLIEQAFFEN